MIRLLKRNPDFACRKVAGETILLPIKKRTADFESLYTLNEVGGLIWESLEKGGTRETVAEAVLHEYEGERAVVLNDVGKFIDQMVKVGAVLES